MKKFNIGLIIAALAVSSCDDDFEPGRGSQHMDKIGYNISMAQDDEFKSRGSSTNTHITVNKLDATIGGKDLYLHTVVKDTISKNNSSVEN